MTVQRLSSEAAIERLQPSVVLVSWMPSGIDWTCHCRECPSVREYILLGERDGSTCGDGWATWGLVPDNGYEYGLDDDSPKPYAADGFVLTELADVSRWQICRFDSAAARGFSTAVAFTRADHHERLARQQALREADDADGETLAESWGTHAALPRRRPGGTTADSDRNADPALNRGVSDATGRRR